MQLISPLAAGVRGAENGTVSFVLRGTATASPYYADFEATQQYPGTSVALDSSGSLVAYVDALVGVKVYDDQGSLVREFVAGHEDAAVEVISPSFTGVDYTSGASGVQKPTNLEKVLDSWITSAGAPDWNILSNGSAVTLKSLGGLFFNVKSYGAIGNGVADDGSAITAANAAATAVGGGIVYFPPGTYRITTAQTLPQNMTWMGNGGGSSKLAIDSGVGAGLLTLPAAAAGSISTVTGMWFGAINGAVPGALISASSTSTGECHFTDCTFGNDALTNSNLYINNTSVSSLKVVFTRCYAKVSAGATTMFQHYGGGRFVMRDCDVISSQATPGTMIVCEDGGLFEGNRFDGSAGTLGTLVYISCAPGVVGGAGGLIITGNRFAKNLAIPAATYAINNTSAAPIFDVMESGNIFGDSAGGSFGIIPYLYTTDGYVSFANTFNNVAHLSRNGKTEVYPAVTPTISVDPKAYGSTVVQRLAGAALTVNANKGSQGDRWVMHIINATGGGVTVTPGTNIIIDPNVTAGTVVLPAASNCRCELQWLPSAAGTGFWYLVAKTVIA